VEQGFSPAVRLNEQSALAAEVPWKQKSRLNGRLAAKDLGFAFSGSVLIRVHLSGEAVDQR